MGRSAFREPAEATPSSRVWLFRAGLALVAANLLTYAPVREHPFIAFDDPQYVAENSHVNTGLSADNVAWAFTSGEQGNWHPLTWISHMIDVDLFGLDAGAHHLTNVAIHTLNSLLLLLLLVVLTGARWRSLLVAALFAVHPMHVESVAWIAERKDLLSALFWMATLSAYAAYARAPGAARYAAVVGLFAAGLMSKPMVVTLPCVLLLLDVWPLGRIAPVLDVRAWRPLIVEKLPLFAMTAATSAVTFLVQQQSGAVKTLENLPPGRRLETALLGYQTYISRLVWPRDLAVLYPFPESIPFWQTAFAAAGLGLVTWLAWRARRGRPWLLVGWLWFVGVLVPVSGLVQVGSQPFADRFTYIPYIGLFVVIAWGGADLAARRPPLARAVWPVTVGVLVAFAAGARHQVAHWRDSITLWTRALDVTDRNYRAHSALGFALTEAGRTDEAAAQFNAALAIRPSYAEALSNLGMLRAQEGDLAAASAHLSAALAVDGDFVEALGNLGTVRARQGRLDEAIALFERARALAPDSGDVRNGFGYALALQGRLDEARAQAAEAIRLSPGFADAHSNMGLILGDLGDLDGAIAAFRQALALDANHARSRYGLGAVLDDAGRPGEAVVELAVAVRLDPALAEAHNRLGRVLLQLERVDEALPAFEAAVRARPAEPDFHYDLGAVLFGLERPADAIPHFENALRLDPGHAAARSALQRLGRIK